MSDSQVRISVTLHLMLATALLAAGAGSFNRKSPMCAAEEPKRSTLIDLTDVEAVRKNRPILIAHRGGVITPQSPECSLAAIRKAAERGYQLVELDVRRSRDHVPVVFHDRDLLRATGREGLIAELDMEQLQHIRYRQTPETISTLDNALALCRSLGLGVMLDVKVADSPRMLEQVAGFVRKHALERSTITLNSDPKIAVPLAAVSLVSVKAKAQAQRPAREGQPLAGYFWFGLPNELPRDELPTWQREGLLIFPAINTFRYAAERHREMAAQDIRRLKEWGVDGFQIDSVYQEEFGLPAAISPKPQGE